MKSIGPCILSFVFILLGAALLYFGIESLRTAGATTTWPTVQGRIASSTVQSRNSSKGGKSYHAEIVYEYSVGDALYSANTVAIGEFSWGGRSHAQGLVKRYPAGSDVAVHYSPDNLTMSVLEAGISAKAFLLPGVGAVFICCGLAALLRIARPRRSR
jgi:hypothetical protein